MPYKVEKIDGTNATLQDCRELFRIMTDAFRSDIIQVELSSPETRLNDESLPPIADFEKFKKKIAIFENRVNVRGLHLYRSMITDPRTVSYALRNTETSLFEAFTLWNLPEYATELSFEPTVLRSLYGFILKIYAKIYEYFHPTKSAFPKIMEEFDWVSEHSGLNLGKPHTLDSLKALDRKHLEEIVYPKQYCYYLGLLAVRSDKQGKGLGKKVLQTSISEISKYSVPPPGVNGPAKLLWQSAPAAGPFYTHLGYNAGPTLVSPRRFNHAVFFANVD